MEPGEAVKRKTRLVVAGLVLALAGAVWAAWPWIITEREQLKMRLVEPWGAHDLFIERIDGDRSLVFASDLRGSRGAPIVAGWREKHRWKGTDLGTRKLWDEAGWLRVHSFLLDSKSIVVQFWDDRGAPIGARRLRNRDGRLISVRIPKSSDLYPQAREEPDAPWAGRKITLEQWCDERGVDW